MIIIDIDMPTGCSSCPIYDGEYGECQLRTYFPSRFANVHALFDDKPNNCPLRETETKKCPICGSDLHEYCFMCCYEGEKVIKNNDTTPDNR